MKYTSEYKNPPATHRVTAKLFWRLAYLRTQHYLRLLPPLMLFACVVLLPAGCTPNAGVKFAAKDSVPVTDLVPEAERIVQESLTGQDPIGRVNAIEVVATARHIRYMPIVQRLLKDSSAPVRFAGALAVGDLQYALAQKDVAGLLNDQNESVRIAGAYAMYRLGKGEAYDTVLHAIAAADPTVRANAALLLGKAGNKAALRYLWWVLGRDDYKIQLQAAESIAMLGDQRVLEKSWATALSAYADDRVMGIRALGALGTAKAKDILLTKLDDDILEVRLVAAEQLGLLGDNTGEAEVRDVFTKSLTSGLRGAELERVRVLTALAVGRICTPSLGRMLPQLLKDESQAVRIAAAKAVFLCAAKSPADQRQAL